MTSETPSTQQSDTTISITRIFDAPREHVWAAWTTPSQFAQWFGAGLPAPANYTSMDLNPGGAWESTMVLSEDGSQTKKFWGEYREVSEPERLVLTFTDDPSGYALVTVVLENHDGKTRMSFTQVGPLPEEQVEAATNGWKGFFEQLAQLVANG